MTLYDPLTWDNLMVGLTAHFELQPCVPLLHVQDVEGPGIYALFYRGAFPAYQPIAATSHPIYVGKAEPPGGRKGVTQVDETQPAMQRRIAIHLRSITAARNLEAEDFKCRHLAIVPVWITLAERFLVERYRPVWNQTLDGFGNNDQGRARSGVASWWDTLHPGRVWAEKQPHVKTKKQALERVAEFFAKAGP